MGKSLPRTDAFRARSGNAVYAALVNARIRIRN